MLTGLEYAYGTPFYTNRGAPLGMLARKPKSALGNVICDDTGCWDDGTGSAVNNAGGTPVLCPGSPGCPGGAAVNVGGGNVTVTPTPTPINWSTFGPTLANTIATDFSSIYKAIQPVPAGCTTVSNPNGTSYVSCSSTGTAPNLTSVLGSASSLLPIVGIGLAALFAFSLVKSK